MSSPDFHRVDHRGQGGKMNRVQSGISQDCAQLIALRGPGHQELPRPAYEMTNELLNDTIRCLFFELMIDTEEQHDVVAAVVIPTERCFQGRGAFREVDDLEPRWSRDFG